MHLTNPRSNTSRLHRASWFSLLIASLAYGQLTQPTNPAISEKEKPAQSSKLSSDDSVLTLPPFEITAARRKEENVQQVPISISSYSQQMLENNNLQVLQDLGQRTTSMTVNAGNTGIREQSNVTIRGQGVSNISGLPAVGMYLNEVPVPGTFDANLAGGPGLYFDLETIDVLKGPQGTLFGLNTMGGAVLLRTAGPKNEFGGNIQFGFGNYNNREISGVFNLPIISDKLLFRFAWNEQTRDGFTRVLSSPKYPEGFDADNRDWRSFRATLTFRPSKNFQNDLIVTSSRYKSNGTASFLTDLAAPATDFFPGMAAEFAQQQALGARVHVAVDTDSDETEGDLLALENITSFTLSDSLKVKNIFGYRDSLIVEASDTDGTKFGLFSLLTRRGKIEQFTEEIQLLGNNFDQKLDWTLGAFYLDAAPPDNYFALQQVRVLFPDILPVQRALRREEATSRGYFAHGIYDLGSLLQGLKMNAGIRYSTDDRLLLAASPDTPDVVTRTPQNSAAWTGMLGVDYQLASDKLLYLALRRGYRAGGAIGINDPVVFISYDPEYLNDLEVGLKMDWRIAGIPVRANLALYTDDYTDMQVTTQIPNPQPGPGKLPMVNITQNAAKARIQGAEIDLLARVTRDLELSANYSYLSFKYKEFGANVVDPGALEASKRANRVPRKYGFGARYFLPVRSPLGTVVASWSYQWTDACADYLGTSEIPAYGIHNAAINWDNIAQKPFDLSLFCSNVADKTYYSGGIGFLGFWQKSYGEPRMYGARIRYRF